MRNFEDDGFNRAGDFLEGQRNQFEATKEIYSWSVECGELGDDDANGSNYSTTHEGVQSSKSSLGVAGWATGLKLGSGSPGVTYNPHRIIGITLFCLGTLQAQRQGEAQILLEHHIICHTFTGYTVIVLSIVNVFKGLNMLEVEMKWRMGYIGFLIFLGGFAIFMEAFTWHIVLKRRKETSSSSATSTKTVEDQEATTAAA
ncbi:hypothetical protein Leryth_027322 [Lithospermum erythrorhizon]|nr:hypothetical protein Leryth_027322 [Lithospermum erythrorhizon]